MAAVAALIELGIGGSVLLNYGLVAVIVNVAVIAWWLRTRNPVKPSASWRWGWAIATIAFIVGGAAICLSTLRTPFIGWDGNSIWLSHTLMAYGGHHAYLTGLQNIAYAFSNPDYPPLVPAAGALAFKFFGLGDLHLAADMTTLLSACALGVVGTGLATTVTRGGTVARGGTAARVTAVLAAGAMCMVGFGVSGGYGFAGYADLLWAATLSGAVIWGLVLPQANQALGVAWICAAAASMTKNEGLTAALIVLVLISLRYRPLTMPGPQLRRWTERGLFVLVPALPGLAWAGLIHLLGIPDNFFKTASTESAGMRAHATIIAMERYLGVAPVALAVLVAGWLFLRGHRERAGLGNPLWVWAACLAYLAVLFATYVFGDLEIHWWLANSVNRTTIFAQLVLFSELATWLVIAADGIFGRADSEPVTGQDANPRDATRAATPT
jgi:hypothetical protein